MRSQNFVSRIPIPGRVLLVICSQTCLKSFVICAGPYSKDFVFRARDARSARSARKNTFFHVKYQ